LPFFFVFIELRLVISKLDLLQVNPAQTRVQRYEKKIQGIIKISLLKTVKKAKTKAGINFPGPG